MIRHVQAKDIKQGMRIRRDGVTEVVTGADSYLAPGIGERFIVTTGHSGESQSTSPGYLYVVIEEEAGSP